VRGDLRVGLLCQHTADDRLALLGRQGAQGVAKVHIDVAGHDVHSLIVELDRRHAQPLAVLVGDAPAAYRLGDLVARDPEQPGDRRAARRVELLAMLQGAREGLGHHVEDKVRLAGPPRDVRDDGPHVPLVELTKGHRVASAQKVLVGGWLTHHPPLCASAGFCDQRRDRAVDHRGGPELRRGGPELRSTRSRNELAGSTVAPAART
jgi:hypothetical protein